MIRPVAADGRIETGGVFTPLHRPRVVGRIQAASSHRIVLIIAPAGYGKSVALGQYLEGLNEPLIRFNLHSDNASLLGFARGLSDAISEIAADALKTVSGAYDRNRPSKTPGADLAMWLHAHIKTFTGVIAIDDFHIAEADPEVSRFLVSLIDRTRGRIRWVIAARSTLDLPVGSWLAYGDMDLTIDEQDLRFTLDEARQAAKLSRVAIRDDELAEVLTMTDGWPTALSFALRTSTRSADLRKVAATTREMIYRYLAEQVYESLDEKHREFLHFVAYLKEIDVSVLRVAGYTDADALIADLRNRVAFIYQDSSGIYRCHDLFRDFLQHQHSLAGDATVETTLRRAATALEELDKQADALRIYSKIASWRDTVRILETHGLNLIECGHADAIQLALESVPHDIRAKHPVALGLRGLNEANSGHFDRGESLLLRAIEASSDAEIRAQFAVRLSLIRINQMRDVVEILEPHLHGTELAPGLKGEIVSLLAIAYAQCGREADAQEAIASAERILHDLEDDRDSAKILHRVGNAISHLGMSLERSTAAQTQAAAIASRHGMFSLAGRAFISLANIEGRYEGESSREVWYAQQGANAAQKAGDRFALQTALLQLLNVENRRGNISRVKALDQQLDSVSTSDAGRIAYVVPSRAYLHAIEGRFDEAHRLMASIEESQRFYDFDRIMNLALDALFLIGAHERESAVAKAARVLDQISSVQSPVPNRRTKVEMSRLICSAVEALSGRGSHAQRILAKKEGDVAPVVSAFRESVIRIGRAAKSPALKSEALESLGPVTVLGYGGLAQILRAVIDSCIHSTEIDDARLTHTEVAVLKALSRGQTPKDIAMEMGRSTYTVQKHIHNITKKLSCSGRNEALTIARQRGVIT